MTALGQELADALGDLRDRHEIGDLLMRYATALDTRDWALLENVFTPDAVADYGELGDGVHHGVEAIVQACRSALIGLDATQHIITNVTVEVTGDEAWASCYLHAQTPGPPRRGRHVTVGGIYATVCAARPAGGESCTASCARCGPAATRGCSPCRRSGRDSNPRATHNAAGCFQGSCNQPDSATAPGAGRRPQRAPNRAPSIP